VLCQECWQNRCFVSIEAGARRCGRGISRVQAEKHPTGMRKIIGIGRGLGRDGRRFPLHLSGPADGEAHRGISPRADRRELSG
jgi:hypothetical protein